MSDTTPHPDPAAPATVRLLYVEDNRLNAMLFTEAIRLREGIELRIAEDGAAAIDMARDWHPDVLVLDAHLPDMNGFDLLRALRGQPGLAEVPAFMCSADATTGDIQRATDAGFSGYWCKPIDLARIMSDLDQACARLPHSPRP